MRWASEIRKISDKAELESFIACHLVPAKKALSDQFDDTLRYLDTALMQKYRLRYILAKLAQYIDTQAYGETEGTKRLDRYIGKDFEIEHIFPQQPSEEAAVEFGDISDPNVTNLLGNLVLVEKSINASLSNRPYSQKRDIYRQSQLLLTKALAERPSVGVNTRIDVAVKDLDPFDEWNEKAVIAYQKKLIGLARLVWGLPPLSVE